MDREWMAPQERQEKKGEDFRAQKKHILDSRGSRDNQRHPEYIGRAQHQGQQGKKQGLKPPSPVF